jgi:hypothetical protein
VRDVFEAALEEAPAADPQAWLDKRGVDSGVRREVLSLLDHHSRRLVPRRRHRRPCAELLDEDEALERQLSDTTESSAWITGAVRWAACIWRPAQLGRRVA